MKGSTKFWLSFTICVFGAACYISKEFMTFLFVFYGLFCIFTAPVGFDSSMREDEPGKTMAYFNIVFYICMFLRWFNKLLDKHLDI